MRYVVSLAVLFALGFGAAAAADSSTSELTVQGGAQLVSVSGDRDSKFFEYRDVPQGIVFEGFKFKWGQPDGPWALKLSATDVLQNDQRYRMSWEKAGTFRLRASWDQTPHFFSRGSTSLLSGTPGFATLSPALRQSLENLVQPESPGVADVPAFEAAVRETLATTARPLDLRIRRDRAQAGLTLPFAAGWELSVDAAREKIDGVNRIGTGTYIRRQAVASDATSGPNFFDRERFEPRGLELPLPYRQRTSDYALAVSLHKKLGFFTAGISGSRFSNEIDSLVWDNPFEAPGSAVSSSLPLFLGADQEPSAAQGNTFTTNNRGRFARAQLALAPDNTYQRFFASGGVNLPARTRITASASIATMEQDVPFVPYTLNESILFSYGLDGLPGGGDDVLARDQALPRSSLGGDVTTTRYELRVVSRPIDLLSLRAVWRSYEYENDTDVMLLPGYAAAGDSYFRPGIGQRDAGNNRVLFTEPGGYKHDRWALGGTLRFGKAGVLDLEYADVSWDYDERQVSGTGETVLKARYNVEPVEWLALRLNWMDGSRERDGDYAIGLETSRVRMFDVWDRDRTRYGLELEVTPADAWTLGLAYANGKDEYPGVVTDPNPLPATGNIFASQPYGLNEAKTDSISGFAGYGKDHYTVSFSVGREGSKWESLATAKTTLASDAIQYDPVNRFRRKQDDTDTWAALSWESWFKPDVFRLRIEMAYHDYDGDYVTENVATPDINSGLAYPFPGLASKLTSASVAATWRVSPKVDFEARYWYEKYTLDDFQWDPMQAYMQGVILETGDAAADLRAMTVNRLLFLDARYSDYKAGVLSALFRLRY